MNERLRIFLCAVAASAVFMLIFPPSDLAFLGLIAIWIFATIFPSRK